mmetsp:Transcript_7649/g.19140  ORF Transcript_7649/g.19140 Transcript_7649/m.19140 type:complete len:234 (+) Transcript_7649:691-1392(+)
MQVSDERVVGVLVHIDVEPIQGEDPTLPGLVQPLQHRLDPQRERRCTLRRVPERQEGALDERRPRTLDGPVVVEDEPRGDQARGGGALLRRLAHAEHEQRPRVALVELLALLEHEIAEPPHHAEVERPKVGPEREVLKELVHKDVHPPTLHQNPLWHLWRVFRDRGKEQLALDDGCPALGQPRPLGGEARGVDGASAARGAVGGAARGRQGLCRREGQCLPLPAVTEPHPRKG